MLHQLFFPFHLNLQFINKSWLINNSVDSNNITKTSILYPSILLTQLKEPPKGLELNLRLKEQECLSILKRCKNLKEFKKVHAHIVK